MKKTKLRKSDEYVNSSLLQKKIKISSCKTNIFDEKRCKLSK